MGTECSQEHGARHFKELARVQKEKLTKLSEIADRHLEVDYLIPDEHEGLLRSASGQAKLLVKERFKQFDGLCDSSLNPKDGEPQIRPEDLAGMWDLIMIEVRSLVYTFSQLAQMARDNWTTSPSELLRVQKPSPMTQVRQEAEKTKKAAMKKALAESPKPLRLPKGTTGLQKIESVDVDTMDTSKMTPVDQQPN